MRKFIVTFSLFALILFLNSDNKNKSFNSSINIFTGSETKNNISKNKHVIPSNDFWSSGKFNF